MRVSSWGNLAVTARHSSTIRAKSRLFEKSWNTKKKVFFNLVALPFRKFKKITTKVVLDKSDCQPRNNPVKKKEQITKKEASGLYGVEKLLSGQTGPENFLIYPSGDSYEANSAFESFSLLSGETQTADNFFHRMLDQTTTKICLILFHSDGLEDVDTWSSWSGRSWDHMSGSKPRLFLDFADAKIFEYLTERWYFILYKSYFVYFLTKLCLILKNQKWNEKWKGEIRLF